MSYEQLQRISPSNSDTFGVRVYIAETDYDLSIKIKILEKNIKTNLSFLELSYALTSERPEVAVIDIPVQVCRAGDGVMMTSFRIDKEWFNNSHFNILYKVLDKAQEDHVYNLTAKRYEWDIDDLTEIRYIELDSFLQKARSVEQDKQTDQNWWLGVGVHESNTMNPLFDKSLDCM